MVGEALHVVATTAGEVVDADAVVRMGHRADDFRRIGVQAEAVGLAHQEMRVAHRVAGEEIVEVGVAARKRPACGEDVLRQFAEGAVVRQERHASGLLQHARLAEDGMGHLAARVVVAVRRVAATAFGRVGVAEKRLRFPPLQCGDCLDCRCHGFSLSGVEYKSPWAVIQPENAQLETVGRCALRAGNG